MLKQHRLIFGKYIVKWLNKTKWIIPRTQRNWRNRKNKTKKYLVKDYRFNELRNKTRYRTEMGSLKYVWNLANKSVIGVLGVYE